MQTTQLSIPQAMQQAAQLEASGQMPAAEALYRQILAAAPQVHPAYHALSLMAYQLGNLPLATELTAKAAAIDGSVGMYQRNLCEMYHRLGQTNKALLDKAIAAGRRAVQLLPDNLDAHYNFALVLAEKKQFADAVSHYEKALAINAQNGLAWNNLGAALEQMGDKINAEVAYFKAVEINPKHNEAQNNLGAIYSEQGKLDEARQCFNTAIAARPGFLEAHFNLSTLKTYKADDPHLMALETLTEVEAMLPLESRIRLNFALGKAREDMQDFERSFAAYAQGNRLQYALTPFNEGNSETLVAKVKRTFTGEFFETHKRAAASDKTPIFIVGMPRAGSTFVEQILASHPAVFGAGELRDLSELIENATKPSFSTWALKASAKDFAKLGKAYEESVWALALDKTYISDKMPGNFFHIGMIHQMLPNAKIINAMRDPMDSCFSCYSRHFTDDMSFAYDLGVLGRYFVRYTQLMRHWHEVLPAGTVLDVRYEDVVADVEGQTRRMLDYIGLPWDDDCLAFHENKRHVKTASVAQVRKPIYKTSVARWERYGVNLDGLMAIVKDYR